MPKPLENRPGSGVLFHQDANGNRPTLRGGVNIGGVEYELVGWDKVGKAGTTFISLSIKRAGDTSWRNRKEKDEKQQPSSQASNVRRPADDDDIPF